MARSLVIVESPAKAKTINKYLGKDYVVRSSVGHIRDLPVGGSTTDAKDRAREAARTKAVPVAERAAYKARRAREQLIRRMGVDPENGWEAQYQILPGKEKVVAELARLAQTADTVYLATDMDREGEAIAWHLRETIGGDPGRYKRVVFNEITRNAIQDAFAEPGELNMNRVNAQQARRFLDRVVGFELSPLLWAKVARGLSAGRVQSVAVRLVVEREREIRAFIPEEYWEAFVDLARAGADDAYRFQLVKFEGANFRPDNGDAAATALAQLRQGGFKVTQREDRPTRTRPNAPFITSTLQQAASTRLGFSVKKTMTLAQRLYEAGHITYMRTDSTNLSAEAVGSARDFIHRTLGDAYLPDKPRLYASKKDAQEAHEAIRPSNVGTEARHLTDMESDAQRLYDLIWRQFVACQMPDAEYISTTVTAEANRCEVRLRGRILTFDGYTRVLPPQGRKDDDLEIPDFSAGETLDLRGAETIQHFTKPPPRYGEASLVRELEKRSIGRPSTYAAIISTIQERGYVTLQNRRFYAEKIGELVTDRLLEKFDNLMDYGFTAEMEAELDRIAEGDLPWRKVLDEFYGDFENKLDNARQEEGGMRANDPTDTDIACPACGRHMQVRTGSTGVFLGCSGYALPPKERCTHTLNLIPGEEAIDVEADEEGESRLLRSRQRCPRCSTAMTPYLIDEGRKLHVCGNNPDCGGFVVEAGTYRIKGYDGPVIACEKCGSDMQLKSGRFGKYFGCTNAECGNTRKLLRNGQAAPPKADPIPMPELRCEKVDDFYLLRDGASGLFLAASQFPKHRETRAPLIRELKSHANELDPKFAYLLSAPEADGEGRPAVLRFSRKTREQYVQSEEEGKPTGWRAFFTDGRWVESRSASSGSDDEADGAAPKRRSTSVSRGVTTKGGKTGVGKVSTTSAAAKSKPPAKKKSAVKTGATNKSKTKSRSTAGVSEE